MAFENIDVSSLRSALTNCKSQLNHSGSDNLLGTLSSNYWMADSKDNLKKALEKLINTRYFNLVSKIDEYLNVTNMIEQYKNLESENIDKRNQISNLQPNLIKTVYYNEYYTDSNGQVQYTTKSYQTEDSAIKSQIDSLNNQINSNISQMEVLKSRIDNAI